MRLARLSFLQFLMVNLSKPINGKLNSLRDGVEFPEDLVLEG